MKDISTIGRSPLARARLLLLAIVASLNCALCGCKDGPMYAMKTINPYFAMNEWKDDEKLGVTDHERLKQLTRLAEQIGSMSAERQVFWSGHLKRIMENDPSPEMRRLAVVAAGKLKHQSSIELIEKGLDDESQKVRLFACDVLGKRPGDQSAQLLASTAGTETDEIVRQAALSALANHKNPIAVDALRIALSDRNPATRDLAMNSLRGATGKNLGNNPDAWIAALDGNSSAKPTTTLR